MVFCIFDMQRLKNHLYYDWWKYAVCIIATFILWDFIADVTRPEVLPEKKLDIYLTDSFIIDEQMDNLSQNILKDFPQLEQINFLPLEYTGTDEDIYGRQKLITLLLARTGDLFTFSKQDYIELAAQGTFENLDPFIQSGEISYLPDYDKYKLISDGELQEHLYGIPLKDISIFDKTDYEYEDKVIVITAYSKNKQNAVKLIKWLIEKSK